MEKLYKDLTLLEVQNICNNYQDSCDKCPLYISSSPYLPCECILNRIWQYDLENNENKINILSKIKYNNSLKNHMVKLKNAICIDSKYEVPNIHLEYNEEMEMSKYDYDKFILYIMNNVISLNEINNEIIVCDFYDFGIKNIDKWEKFINEIFPKNKYYHRDSFLDKEQFIIKSVLYILEAMMNNNFDYKIYNNFLKIFKGGDLYAMENY